MGAPLPPVADEGNEMLDRVLELAAATGRVPPAEMTTGVAEGMGGVRFGVMTVRTPSATVTVLLTPERVRAWADQLNGLHAQLGTSSLVVPGPGAVPEWKPTHRNDRPGG